MKPGWYHVCESYHGESVLMEPRVPRGPAIGEDRTIPRISVGSTIDECLLGITGLKLPKVGFVYRLHGRARGLDTETPQRVVPDWEQSFEAWLMEPNEFRFVCPIIPSYRIGEDDAPSWERNDNPTLWVCPSCHRDLGSKGVGCGCQSEFRPAVPVLFRDWLAAGGSRAREIASSNPA